ncbi:MAG: hypothetical protein ACLFPO_08780 [Spirochaetaceae bacterium]
MGLFGELARKLFGPASKGGASKPRDDGLYFHVRLVQTGEVVEIRLIPRQELVPDYQNGGYFSRKVITGPRTLGRADALFRFDEKRRFTGAEIDGGELVEGNDSAESAAAPTRS